LAHIRGFFAFVAWLMGVVRGGERWKNVGGRCEALTIKAIHGGTGFGAGRTWEPFSPVKGNQIAEKGDRSVGGHSWGFSRLRAHYYRNHGHRGWLLEGLLDDWQGNEDESRSGPANSNPQPNVILALFL